MKERKTHKPAYSNKNGNEQRVIYEHFSTYAKYCAILDLLNVNNHDASNLALTRLAVTFVVNICC